MVFIISFQEYHRHHTRPYHIVFVWVLVNTFHEHSNRNGICYTFANSFFSSNHCLHRIHNLFNEVLIVVSIFSIHRPVGFVLEVLNSPWFQWGLRRWIKRYNGQIHTHPFCRSANIYTQSQQIEKWYRIHDEWKKKSI